MSLADMSPPGEDEAEGGKLFGKNPKPVGSTVATCEEFVSKFGGKRPIEKVLIANNGIAGKFQFLWILYSILNLNLLKPSNV